MQEIAKLQTRFRPHHLAPSEILPGLFLGNIHDARNIEMMQEELGILSIVSLISHEGCFTDDENVEWLGIDADDVADYPISQHFSQTFDFIHSALQSNRNVLVHCRSGQSRAPTIVIAFLMKRYGLRFREASSVVARKRPIISPNIGFIEELKTFERTILSCESSSNTSNS
eukprot:Lithocolla_globosa_v1_NODE_10385_length_603_cov_10.990876.p1 type:complete len:171 gc:universal NODE_10385_length_603_cov_10.990876:544-32(-)